MLERSERGIYSALSVLCIAEDDPTLPRTVMLAAVQCADRFTTVPVLSELAPLFTPGYYICHCEESDDEAIFLSEEIASLPLVARNDNIYILM